MSETRDAQHIWEAALGELQIQVNKPNYRTWLQKTSGLRYQDEQFVIGVPNAFVAEYLDKNQRSLIEKVLTGILGNEVEVKFEVNSNLQTPVQNSAGREKPVPAQQSVLPLFNPNYTFDKFAIGKCNQMAFAAAKGVAQNPGHSYNPLFIYGDAGLGKTHLLQAIGHEAVAQHARVIYVSAEQYTSEFVNAIREKKAREFCAKYRNVDVLLIDDVQFFSGKEQTGENFFHTFNELHNADKQIAMTADCPPESLSALPERLRSRFEWGLVTNVDSPDFDTRLAILQGKAKQKGVDVSPDVLELIAQQIQQNIRALEGSLNRVVAYAALLKSMITPELAALALEDIADKNARTVPVTPKLIVERVAESFRLTVDDLQGSKRDKETILARQIAMYLLKREMECSLTQIGKELGGRDHHIVSHAYKKIADDIITNPGLKTRISDIQQKLYSADR